MADVVISGNTSGSVTLRAPAISGTTILTLPTTTGTLVVTGGAQTIEFAAGSVSAPSITFTGDTNTGIYSPAADTIAFTEGGVESMRIDSSGNVGIGTSSPATLLNLSKSVSGGVGPEIRLNNNAGLANDAARISFAYLTSLRAAFDMEINPGGTGEFIFRSGVGTLTERMRLNNVGNLVLQGGTTTASGVGVTFPATQSASSNANCLDDYEEGTWTPTDASGAGLTFTGPVGQYTKVGNVVFYSFNVTYPTTANTNNAAIGGFPFATSATSGLSNPGSGFITYVNTGTAYTIPMGGGSTTANLYNLGGGLISNASISGSIIRFSGVIYT